jgi:hypothetical protein
MNEWLYAMECIAVPCFIGSVMFVLFDAWDRRRRRVRPEDHLPLVDYSI